MFLDNLQQKIDSLWNIMSEKPIQEAIIIMEKIVA